MREETEKFFEKFVEENPELVKTNDQGVTVIRKSSTEMYDLFMLYLSEKGNTKIDAIAEYIDSEPDGEDSDDDSEAGGEDSNAAIVTVADANPTKFMGESDDLTAMFNAAYAAAGFE